MDNRNRYLRPRTMQGNNELVQPVGWPGRDPLEQRRTDPMRTFETPFIGFPADINIGINTTISIPLPPQCGQIAFLNVVPGVNASLNGGGGRTVKDGFIYTGDFSTLEVQTDATGTCTIQLATY